MQWILRPLLLACLLIVGAAPIAIAAEVDAGLLWGDAEDAGKKCPAVCEKAGGQRWDGTWRVVEIGSKGVCGCQSGAPSWGRPDGGGNRSPVLRYDRTDFTGGDLPDGHAFGQSYDQCAASCQADNRCVAFTVSGTGCYKKASASPSISSGATSGFIAGRGTPPPGGSSGTASFAPPQRPSVTRYTESDLPGNDISEGSGPAGSADECEARCVANSRCAAYTFNAGLRMCYPKSSASAPQRFGGAVSGVLSGR